MKPAPRPARSGPPTPAPAKPAPSRAPQARATTLARRAKPAAHGGGAKRAAAATRAAAARRGPAQSVGINKLAATRELFWHNVMREILTSLSVMSAAGLRPLKEGEEGDPRGHLFDGRLAIISTHGTRIPIGAVYPLFACSIDATAADKALSIAVECTVFQIHTPSGEVFTMPLHEMRSFHALSEDLIREIAKSSRADGGADGDGGEPFGFAAFTSLSRSKLLEDLGTIPSGAD